MNSSKSLPTDTSSSSSSSSKDQPQSIVELIEKSFLCPISMEMMGADAVIAADGFTYSERAIKDWFKKQRSNNTPLRSPLSGEILVNDNLLPNYALRSVIDIWISNRHDIGNLTSSNGMDKPAPTQNMYRLFQNSPNSAQEKLQNSLVSACEKGNLDEVKKLVDDGANLSLPDKNTKFPLSAAIFSLRIELVKYICNKLNPNHDYIKLCIERNIELYGSTTPPFKASNEITLADLYQEYFSKQGRDVVFSNWVIQKLENNIQCWHKIGITEDHAVAYTKKGNQWRFGPSDDTIQSCTKQDAERSIVWALFLNQITFCIEAKGIVEQYLQEKLKASLPLVSSPALQH